MEEVLKLYATALEEYKAENFDSALKIVEKLKIIVPDWAKVTLLEGYIFIRQSKFFSASDTLQKCLSQCTNADISLKAEALSRLGGVYRIIGNKKFAVENFMKSAELEKNLRKKRVEISNAIFSANAGEIFSAQDFQKLYAEYQKTFSDVKPFDEKIYNHEKLRIGYLSADFRRHPVANFIWALIHLRDAKKFSIYCYTNTKIFDEITAQLKNSADFWRDITDVDDETAAKIIRDDEIDILFDLSGHTKDNRLPILAYRPAQVQISGIGYMNSTGTNFVDYFLTDKFCAADLTAWKNFFTEKPLVLPHSHFCYMPLRKFPEVGDAPCIKNGYVTFGCFNNFIKVTGAMIEAWRKILQRVPNSRLILKHQIFDGNEGRETVTNLMKYLGLEGRVELRRFTANYLDEYRDIDIALDTFPYNGGATTCEALSMGVPVISLYGNRHGTRFGYSILNNVGIGELAVNNFDEYIDRAVDLAGDFETLSALHKNLRRMMKNSALMDGKNYVHDVEENFRRILNESTFSNT